ncbi:RecQ family ATP-dependent DNA helicase [Allomyces macrogynus ATCC 38327]|uniref:DNA 3'-5' helicase n=1 Tax=Allomyces macrogynus (strain ATCC 38327) TaxID=578462 RepID=A0A0L0SS61_ALLM3|nr:RecQ family ATP-dependent DNA helicase [Allomyces macrogynus ATCC 38327]|eukprot:KNE65388.1 RecQ family ATP-dependent DNA helicase [Allomyces macrogynus ATCC 38327]
MEQDRRARLVAAKALLQRALHDVEVQLERFHDGHGPADDALLAAIETMSRALPTPVGPDVGGGDSGAADDHDVFGEFGDHENGDDEIEMVEPTLPSADAYDHDDFPWATTLHAAAEALWPTVESWRPGQRAAMNASLSGRDTLVILPTGAGKSLIYQLPALAPVFADPLPAESDRLPLTLVVSPLVALITDQIRNLHARLAAANQRTTFVASLTSTTPPADAREIEKRVRSGRVALLYVTPEKIVQAKRFLALLESVYAHPLAGGGRALARIVVDECHCCSHYGHDFRPDYRKMGGMLRALFPAGAQGVPIVALSATCGPRVRTSVAAILRLHAPVVCAAPLRRANLRWQVAPKPADADAAVTLVADWIQNTWPGAQGIVYCLSRKDTEAVAAALSKKGVRAAAYHADLPANRRAWVHTQWARTHGATNGRVDIVVATTAFGMGIDEPAVRYVVHHSPPRSVDALYQEAGRAGRDGERADCLLLARPADFGRLAAAQIADGRGLDGLQAVYAVAQYAMLTARAQGDDDDDVTVCRQVWLTRYFETAACPSGGGVISSANTTADDDLPSNADSTDPCGICDLCTRQVLAVDATGATRRLLHMAAVPPPAPVKRARAAAGSDDDEDDDDDPAPTTAPAAAPRWTFLKLVTAATKARGKPVLALPAAVRAQTAVPSATLADRALAAMLYGDPPLVREEFHVTPYAAIGYVVPAPVGARALADTGAGGVATLPHAVYVPHYVAWEGAPDATETPAGASGKRGRRAAPKAARGGGARPAKRARTGAARQDAPAAAEDVVVVSDSDFE